MANRKRTGHVALAATFLGGICGVSSLGIVGCAEERDAINRVQANALPKSFFIGEDLAGPEDDPSFFTHGFVVDQSENQSTFTVGQGPGLERVRFDITETHIIAYRAYPNSDGADDRGLEDPDGEIIAAYPIEKHFDIRYAYNTATGEELNVIEENTSDRPWYEREYMRVNWEVTSVVSPVWSDVFFAMTFDGTTRITPESYYVSDPNDENAPHFELENGYFDVTAKMFVEPEPMEIWGMTFPACFIEGLFSGTAVNSCGPSDAFVRHSFVRVDKVDKDNDFEPFENSRASLDILANIGGNGDARALGMYSAPRMSWDAGYGYTDENFHRYMYQHNIWQQSHQTVGSCSSDADCSAGNGSVCLASGTCGVGCLYDNAGDDDGNGTDDQCENAITGYAGSTGSQCSTRDRCTIPYRDRELRQVAYWVTQETPAELQDQLNEAGDVVEVGATEDVMRSWNQLFRHAAARAREVECRRTGEASREDCHNAFFDGKEMVSFGGWDIDRSSDATDIVVTCHNPVRSYDHEVCGTPGDLARLGDVRKNWLIYWPHASNARYGGVVKWNSDPLTGMVVGATATTMGRSATYAAAQFRDVMLVANGELDWKDITDGTPAALFGKTSKHGGRTQALSIDQMDARLAAITGSDIATTVGAAPLVGTTLVEQSLAHLGELATTRAVVGTTSADIRFDAVADRFIGTDLEARMITEGRINDLLGPGGISYDQSFALERVSPLRRAKMKRMQEQYDMETAARGRCVTDAGSGIGNLDVQGAAKHYGTKFDNAALQENAAYAGLSDNDLRDARAEEIYLALWKDMYKGIMLHEVGHSMGMRHQFASSYDSTNYLPQYWQLRTQEGRASASCNGRPRTGDTWRASEDTCMGPRYLDPETDEEMGRGSESRPGINYFAHTSTMEYQVSRFFESSGLGLYDRFFVAATYGRVLEVFDSEVFPEAEQAAFGARNYSQLIGENVVYWENTELQPGAFTQGMHYTKQGERLKLFDAANCREATPDEKATATYRLINNKVCAPVSRDYAAWIDMVDAPAAPDINDLVKKQRVASHVPTYAGNVRWPFRYGENYSNSYLQSNHSDAGADIYEVVTQAIRTFEYDYPTRYFRRQKKDWLSTSVPSRTSDRFFDRLRSLHWSIANSNARWQSLGYAERLGALDDWWRPYVMAEVEMFNALVKSLLMPEANPDAGYAEVTQLGTNESYYDVAGSGSGPFVPAGEFEIDGSNGRYVAPDFDSDPDAGGNWEYQQWEHHTGYSDEKGLVARALVDGRAVFSTISRGNYLDGRNTSINFRSDLTQGIDRLIGGILSEDWLSIGSYVLLDDPEATIGKMSRLPIPPVHATDLTVAGDVTRPAGAKVLFPNIGYDQQLDLLMFTHIFAKVNTDLDLARKMWIWIDGHLGEFDVPEDQQVRFTDANSGFTYIARKYGTELVDGRSIEKGIGSRMLQRANLLLEQVYEVDRDIDGKAIYNEFGQPQITMVDGLAVEREGASYDAKHDLIRYIGLLDTAVQIENTVGYGPLR